MKPREDYRLVLVLYFGVVVVFAAALLYIRVVHRPDRPWSRDAGFLAMIALIFQAGITLLLAHELPAGRRKATGYLVAALSLAGVFLVPWLLLR
ncbi:MAG TPA: hypothetical protein VF950_30680 [Planctomycetota bacterium]